MDRREFISSGASIVAAVSAGIDRVHAQGLRRAAVVIGIRDAAGLPQLKSTIPGANDIAEFLSGESYDVRLHTDETAPVEIGQIRRDIKNFVDQGNLDQLLVYFTGHGIRKTYRGEMWLLSQVLDFPDEAINLVESSEVCNYCRIPNITFVSDACRSTAQSLQLGNVEGSNIFPN